MNKLFPILVRVGSVMVFNANRVACSIPSIVVASFFLLKQQNKQIMERQFDFRVAMETLYVLVADVNAKEGLKILQ
jgi:hypothetical protein